MRIVAKSHSVLSVQGFATEATGAQQRYVRIRRPSEVL